jgi:holo-[acyl-carrier protein] synthase
MGKTIKTIGCDILSLSRFYKILKSYDEYVLGYLFTVNEFKVAKASCDSKLFLAICFSGKEAVSKALGRGMSGRSWNEIEIFPGKDGSAKVRINQETRVAELNYFWELSWDLKDNFIYVLVNGF